MGRVFHPILGNVPVGLVPRISKDPKVMMRLITVKVSLLTWLQ